MAHIGNLRNLVAHKEGIGQKAGNNLHKETVVTRKIVKENVVTIIKPYETVHEEKGCPLHVLDELRQFIPVGQDEIGFVKADDGPMGNVDFKARFGMDAGADEVIRRNVFMVVVVFEADDLRVRMMNRAA